MKNILFVDRDEDIRDYVGRNEHITQVKELNVRISDSLAEAEKLFKCESFDGIIVDATTPGFNNILPFVRSVRSKKPELPIVAMVGFVDMILDNQLKQNLENERVKIVDKVKALQADQIMTLFNGCCDENNGGVL